MNVIGCLSSSTLKMGVQGGLPSLTHHIIHIDFLETCSRKQLQNLSRGCSQESLQFDWKWSHHLLPVGSKSHESDNFGSLSGRDFSITILPISIRFRVWEMTIQVQHFLLCDRMTFYSLDLKMGLNWTIRHLRFA